MLWKCAGLVHPVPFSSVLAFIMHTLSVTCTHAHTHTTVLWLCILSGTIQMSRYQKKHSYLSWSSIISYLLPPSSTIHGILCVQFTCLTVSVVSPWPWPWPKTQGHKPWQWTKNAVWNFYFFLYCIRSGSIFTTYLQHGYLVIPHS